MKVDGQCHCGQIRYEAEIDPEQIFICHCTDCQTLSGSAYRTLAKTVVDGLKVISGTPKIYVKIGSSGSRRQQSFCPECGSPIYSAADEDGPKVYNLRAGTITQRNELKPKAQNWTKSSLDWVGDLSEIRVV